MASDIDTDQQRLSPQDITRPWNKHNKSMYNPGPVSSQAVYPLPVLNIGCQRWHGTVGRDRFSQTILPLNVFISMVLC